MRDRIHRFLALLVGLKNPSSALDYANAAQSTRSLLTRLTGTESSDDRETHRHAFNTPFPRWVAVATGVAEVGVDLQRECARVVHHDLEWNPATMEERVGRVDRIGSMIERELQTNPDAKLFVGTPYIRGTIDERMWRRGQERRKWIGVFLGERVTIDDEDLDTDSVPVPDAITGPLRMNLELAGGEHMPGGKVTRRFPFGAEVRSVSRAPDGHRSVFLLGAYPSALHVQWDPPPGASLKPIKALAVDNEAEPFWDGRDEAEHVAAWAAKHFDVANGRIEPAGRLNGSSGRWVHDLVLEPLAATMDDVWLTDCLDTYRCSAGQSKRLADTYAPYAGQHGLPEAELQGHPDENAIVIEALDQQRERLLSELRITQPNMIVTLGRAAARVIHDLLELDSEAGTLLQEAYGDIVIVSCNDKPTQLLCLAHPGAPGSWQQTHLDWVTEQGTRTGQGHQPHSIGRRAGFPRSC